MPNVIDPGTEDCDPNTLSGDIFAAFSALVDPGDLPLVETAFKRISFAVASGWVVNVVGSIDDTKYLQINSGEIVGGDGGSGGEAPDSATYVVASANGSLSAERVATTTATVSVDTSTPGQMKWVVASVAGVSGLLVTPQTPATHASSHALLGSDPIKLDDLAAPDDNTDLNASTGAHGLLRKLSGTSTEFLNGGGSWATPTGIVPSAHKTSHENSGTDEINVTGLSGLLADDQNPVAHASDHANGGGDEMNVAGLSGELADPQPPKTHATSHQNGGGDEINVAGLSGVLADAQLPADHASSHGPLGTDALRLDDLEAPEDNTDLNASTSAHGLAPKGSGYAGEFLSGLHTWLIPAENPKTIYELDWTAESTQLGIASGTVVVDGVNWTAANAADASLFRIQNGSGLQITATAGVSKTWTGATNTSPSMRVVFEDLAADAAKYQLTLTVWSYFSAWSLPNSSNGILVGCYAPAGAVYTAVICGAGFNNNGAGSFPTLQRSATFTQATALGSGYDVIVWRFLPGGTSDSYCGSWSAGWPTALTPIGNDTQPSASTIVTTALIRRAGATLIYTPMTRSASGAPSFTLARTRIQVG
jgi:hypothetical protein